MSTVVTVVAVLVPIAEIAVFAFVADRIGILTTIGLLLVLTAVGAVLLVQQGIGTIRRLRETMRRRESPSKDLADAALIAFGGLLLLTPGFFTDVLALVVVFPPSRAALSRWLRRGATAVAATRLGWTGKAAVGAKTIYDVKATKVSRPSSGSGPPEPPPQLPSSTRASDEDGSPDTG